MSRKLIAAGVVVVATALGAFALGWYFGPWRAGWAMPMSSMGYWMHAGMGPGMHYGMMPGGWMSLGWGGMWLMALFGLAVWVLPIALVVGVILWLVKRKLPQSKT